jgi:energy-coupling factor transporter ATP-binding protein EcfA2
MMEHEALLSRLTDINKFKQDVLQSYMKANEPLYLDLMAAYEGAEKRQKEIEEEARKQRTQWETVINIFNERFFVPFKLEVKNREAVILGYETMMNLGFIYEDGADSAELPRDDLVRRLSTGERRALYILNVIFEIETRKKANQETLFVFDDIADSFDYQNKYAIIQYLKDISEDGLFKQIIMTHNFDFFRTIQSRFVPYSRCLMAAKTSKGIILDRAAGIRNVFVNDWKAHFFNDPKKKIASIPFLRNLVEYSEGEDDPRYKKLTALLHWKANSAAITVGELDQIYNETCKPAGASPDQGKLVWALIQEQATECLKAGPGINFENKIVLAIAIRVTAERFMVDKIGDAAFVAGIASHQTQTLAERFKRDFRDGTRNIEILDRVLLMTPENIHLNSFMYEPIVDMSDEHLKKLYSDVTELG